MMRVCVQLHSMEDSNDESVCTASLNGNVGHIYVGNGSFSESESL